MADKKQIRSVVAAARKRLVLEEQAWRSASERICSHLLDVQSFGDAGTVLLYYELPGEVVMSSLVERLFFQGVRVVLPLVRRLESGAPSLSLREYSPDKLVAGYKGIMEPTEDSLVVKAEEIDFAVIPGVAFSRDGSRLGRGGGFYDSLLSELGCPKAGVCFDFQLLGTSEASALGLPRELPLDPWDLPVDMVVTPSGVYKSSLLDGLLKK